MMEEIASISHLGLLKLAVRPESPYRFSKAVR